MEDKNSEIGKRYKVQSIEKKYTQFSKKIVAFCLTNLVLAELFVAVMIVYSGDTSSLGYFLTSISIECLGCVVWYMKNSESEKVARIKAEIEKDKMNNVSNITFEDNEPYDDTYDGGKG